MSKTSWMKYNTHIIEAQKNYRNSQSLEDENKRGNPNAPNFGS